MPVQLKKATSIDIPVLLELEKSVAGINIYSPILEREEWEDELQKCSVYLIQKNNTTVGSISYKKQDGGNVYISGLVINPHFQGQGIAHEVLVNLLIELKDFKRVGLVTHPNNTPALRLYQSLGFVVEDKKENYYGDGEPRLVLVLKRTN